MAATDLVTPTEASTYLQIPGDMTLVTGWISAISDRLDDLCGPIVARAVTETLTPYGDTAILRHRPIYSVTTVTEYSGTTGQVLTLATNSSQPTTGYHLNTLNGLLTRRSGSGRANFPVQDKCLEITYSAGRYATTATVSDRFKQACHMSIALSYQNEHGTRNQTFGNLEAGDGAIFGPGWVIPRRALDLLGNELVARIGIA